MAYFNLSRHSHSSKGVSSHWIEYVQSGSLVALILPSTVIPGWSLPPAYLLSLLIPFHSISVVPYQPRKWFHQPYRKDGWKTNLLFNKKGWMCRHIGIRPGWSTTLSSDKNLNKDVRALIELIDHRKDGLINQGWLDQVHWKSNRLGIR